ncbi:transmembrane protein 79-like [Ostrea edulis]|uniref:transmembrane protein 79-like n=1 Tax=Ostrea edulis TaxID=37623 RepID=UPI0024AFD183|nr:transmembrane protein 79-like [Ostrea edulis]
MAEMNDKEKAEHQKLLNWVYKEFAAAAVVIGVVYYAVSLIPLDVETVQTPCDRLVFALRWLFISSLPIVFAIFGVLDVRGNTKAIDPIKGGAENLVELPNRILRNTIEQFSLHAVGVLALTTYLDERSMSNIRALVALFFLGRILFAMGYKSSPSNRGFGFAITFMPTLVTYGYVLYKFVTTYILGF